MWVCMQVYVCVRVCVRVHVSVCVRVNLCVQAWLRACVCDWIAVVGWLHGNVCMCGCICMWLYAHCMWSVEKVALLSCSCGVLCCCCQVVPYAWYCLVVTYGPCIVGGVWAACQRGCLHAHSVCAATDATFSTICMRACVPMKCMCVCVHVQFRHKCAHLCVCAGSAGTPTHKPPTTLLPLHRTSLPSDKVIIRFETERS